MPRKARKPSPSPSPSPSSASEDLTSTDPPTSINPYIVLSLERTATPEQITKAYRLSALRSHPDKAPSANLKEEYTRKFQEIAFAYAVLSDPARRRRYDTTGNTSESLDLDDDNFDWASYFKEKYEEAVSSDAIEKVKREYQGSEEEKEDVLAAYEQGKGDMDIVFESVMCSDIFADDDRFRKIIDQAIADREVKSFTKYTSETKAGREKRRKKASAEAKEAEELAEELGVRDKLFGNASSSASSSKGKGKGKGTKSSNSEDALAAIIQQRQKARHGEDFFARLEQKYASAPAGAGKFNSKPKSNGKKTAAAAKKRSTPSGEEEDEDVDMSDDGAGEAGNDDDEGPSEEAFRAMQERGKKSREERERGSKRVKVRR